MMGAHNVHVLESAGLIHLVQVEPEIAYLFRHALVQEAAYVSLLKHDRQRLHQAVGEALERAYPDRLAEYAPLLARHFAEAADERRALHYYTMAGDAASRHYANVEAVAHYTAALGIARQWKTPDLGTIDDTPLLTHVYLHRGRALELDGQFEAALQNYQELEAQSRERADPTMELAALMARARTHSIPSQLFDFAQGRALSDRALALARQLADRTAEAEILWNLLLLYWTHGDSGTAVGYGEESLAIARALQLTKQLARTLNNLGWAYMDDGQLARARTAADEARALLHALGDQSLLADNLNSCIWIYFWQGDYQRALEFGQQALDISRSIANLWGEITSLVMLSMVYYERADFGSAMQSLRRVTESGYVGYETVVSAGSAMLGWGYGTLGMPQRGLELCRHIKSIAHEFPEGVRPWPLALIALLELQSGDTAAAVATFAASADGVDMQKVSTPATVLIRIGRCQLALAAADYPGATATADEFIAFLTGLELSSYLPDALFLKASGLAGQDLIDQACDLLALARSEAERLGACRVLWPILHLLGRLEARRGNAAEAERLHSEGRQIVETIAAGLPDSELRAAFLNLPDVRALVETA